MLLLPTAQANAVTVPDCGLVNSDEDRQVLRQVNPLASSDNYGKELYEQVVGLIETFLH